MQTSLPIPGLYTESGVPSRVRVEDIHVSKSTFLNGLATKVHRWFRLTPSFGPELVHEMIDRLEVTPSETILDPFAGAGTTLIEAKLEGRRSYGFEINPLLHFVNEVSLDWSLDSQSLVRDLKLIEQKFALDASRITYEILEAHGLTVPPIHNPHRWWREDVLVHLLILKRSILSLNSDSHRRFFLLAFAGVLVPDLTNVTLGKLQLHFIDRSEHDIRVWDTFANHVTQMVDDMGELHTLQETTASCIHADATNLGAVQPAHKIDAVITSPPYPNRYSYVWNTRPHLYMLDMVTTGKQATEIDLSTIGGTWGTATSILSKGVYPPYNRAVDEAVSSTVSAIRDKDNLMANYVMHYFNRLTKQIEEMEPILSSDARVAYVVGNSWIKGEYVETDVLLGEIFERMNLGYSVTNVHRFRRRHSGKRLYESIVFATKRR